MNGLEIDGAAAPEGTFLVAAAGSLLAGQSVSVRRADHPFATEWRVALSPEGVRDAAAEAVRPSWEIAESAVTITAGPAASPHGYLVLVR